MNTGIRLAPVDGFWAAGLLVCASLSACATTPTSGASDRTVLAHELPPAFGKKPHVELFEVQYGPGGSSPTHRHGCPVVGYVLSGTLRTQLQGGPIRVYGPGEAFYEDPSDIHTLSENAGQSQARFLAFFVCDDDRSLYMKLDPAGAR